ncbi:hypothetical protein TrLO_g196 [Triparma laevis f. longispina]|uniref:WW domain-containing protein n=1 Tax=Triparma laevis f. longispina TaxID=1714387 RepID=A0A9W6ZK37_9STRA|nr:hypothetical protein TrLO_g196 [Triparma laevis f. longispina]
MASSKGKGGESKLKQRNKALESQNEALGQELEAMKQRVVKEDSEKAEIPQESPWQMFEDDEGRIYYYHAVTKETTYEKPAERS